MSEQKLNIEYVDASLLKPAEYNPRKWDEVAIQV